MTVGIDGNQWYASNGLCLGDPRALFVFADTLREAIDQYNKKNPKNPIRTIGNEKFLDMTPEQYKNYCKEKECAPSTK